MEAGSAEAELSYVGYLYYSSVALGNPFDLNATRCYGLFYLCCYACAACAVLPTLP